MRHMQDHHLFSFTDKRYGLIIINSREINSLTVAQVIDKWMKVLDEGKEIDFYWSHLEQKKGEVRQMGAQV